MKIIEITEKEFNEFSGEDNYFCNGCYFDKNDNILSFPFYDSYDGPVSKYFKVVYNEC